MTTASLVNAEHLTHGTLEPGGGEAKNVQFGGMA